MKRNWLAVAIILLFVGITISPGILAYKDYSKSRTDFEISLTDYEFVGIDGITERYLGPYPFGFEWVINIKIKNIGDTKSGIHIKGEMYRISRPFHRVGFVSVYTTRFNPWYTGQIIVVDTIAYDSSSSLIPGIYSLYVKLGESFTGPHTYVWWGHYFIFWNHIFPKNRLM